jgi:hypothetical protein
MSADPRFAWMTDAQAARLNGASDFRTASTIRFEQEGDGLVGEVVAVARSRFGFANQWADDDGIVKLTCRVHAARSNGVELDAGDWVDLFLTSAALRKAWVQIGGVEKGDTIIVGYLGREAYSRGTRHAYAFSVERAEAEAKDEGWNQ